MTIEIAAERTVPARARRRLAAVPRLVWLLLLVALALRVALVLATYNVPLTLDPADWSRTALSIAQGHGFPMSNRAPAGGPSAFRPPGYPALLAGVYAIAGQEAAPAGRIVGGVLGTLVVALIGWIAFRIWGRRVAVIAVAIAAVAPPLIVFSTALVSEALFVPLVLAAVAAALEVRRSPHPLRWTVACGVLIGAAELTRTNAAVLVVPLGIAVWTGRPRLRLRSLLAPAALIAATVLTVAPWTIRNAVALHAFVPVSTEIGYTIAGTYDDASRADHHWPAVWKEVEHGASPEYRQIVFDATVQRLDERTFGDRLQAKAIADIGNHPLYPLKVALWNTIRLFQVSELDFAGHNLRDTDVPRGPALAEIFGFYPLVALALGGLVLGDVRRAPWWLWLVPLGLASTVFVTSFIRFRAPLDPFLVILAALALATLPFGRDAPRPSG